MTAQDLLGRLDGVRKSGRGWIARCPAHDDRTQSLSVGVGEDGKILLNCHAGCATRGVVEKLAIGIGELFAEGAKTGRAAVVATYDYRDERGDLLFQVVRFAGKQFRQRRPNSNAEWAWNLDGTRRVLYRLPELLAAEQDERVFVPEGEKDVDNLRSIGLIATCNPMGAKKWHFIADHAKEVLRGRHVVVLPDKDAPGREHAEQVAGSLVGSVASVRVIEPPGEGKDISDWIAAGGTASDLHVLAQTTPEWRTSASMDDRSGEEVRPERKTKTQEIVELVLAGTSGTHGTVLFHSPDRKAFATFSIDAHVETWPIRSQAFSHYLRHLYHSATGKAASAATITDARDMVEARALFDGHEEESHTRLGEGDGAIYLDLCDAAWRVVEITANGWNVSPEPRMRFRRMRGMLALPVPERGGSLEELRKFVNVSPDDWPLLVAWLLAALRSHGPFPVLAIHGEQGSAKSTAARMVRALIDPNKAAVRAAPRDPHDLMIAATNGWIVSLDNLSDLPVWLSDALCRLSTGGGFATRELYTDSEESIFDAQRPVIVNGIEDLATRGDLMDRAIILYLPSIPEDKRRPEGELWREFEEARPRILGALLDAVVCALRELPAVSLSTLPRMADFALWATAAEQALGLERGAFMTAYMANRKGANELVLESSAVIPALRAMLADSVSWTGTASELLAALDKQASEATRKQQSWPRNGRKLSGILRRLAPNLRAAGIEIAFEREAGGVRRRTISVRTSASSSQPSRSSQSDANTAKLREAGEGRTWDESRDGNRIKPSQEKPNGNNGWDAWDGRDAESTAPQIEDLDEEVL